MNTWFRLIILSTFICLFGTAGHAQLPTGCKQLPVLNEGFENGWDGWSGAITSNPQNGPVYATGPGWVWPSCPTSWTYGQTFRENSTAVTNSAWCIHGPGGYSTSSNSAVLDMSCSGSGTYIEATLTSPQVNFASSCDPSLPPPTFQFDFCYIPDFTNAGTPGMYVEATTDVTQPSPTWVVVANYGDLDIAGGGIAATNYQYTTNLFPNPCQFPYKAPNSGQWTTLTVQLPGAIAQSTKAAIRFRIYDFGAGRGGYSSISPVYIDNCICNGPYNQDLAVATLGNIADSAVIVAGQTYTPTITTRLVGNVPYNGSGATLTYQMYQLGNPGNLLYNQSTSLTASLTAQCSQTNPIALPLVLPTATQIQGEYIVQGIVDYPGWDCNIHNDTLQHDLIVGFPYDLKPLVFTQPQSTRVNDIVGVAPTPQGRIRNIGLNAANGFKVECKVWLSTAPGNILYDNTQVVTANIPSGASFSVTFSTLPQSAISTAGIYTFEMISLYGLDNNHGNDTLQQNYQYYWKYDVRADSVICPTNPLSGAYEIPVGAPFDPVGKFENNGADFVAEIPIYFQAWKYPINAGDAPVDTAVDTLQELNISDGQRRFQFNSNPDFGKLWTPAASGTYELIMFSNLYNSTYPQEDDQNPSNDTTKLIITVIPPLSGVYNVGFAQDIPTISAARDSLNYRGIGGNVTFVLTDNNYTISNTLVFAQFRIFAPGANNAWIRTITGARATFAPYVTHTPTITLNSGSEILMTDTVNYVGFDGNNAGNNAPPNRSLSIVQTTAGYPAFFLTDGASEVNISDCNIMTPVVVGNSTQKQNQNSIGIWEHNSYPPPGADTFACNYNFYNNNSIQGYRTGIWLQGLAPVFVAGPGQYTWRMDTNSTVSNNVISNCGRAGILATNQYNIKVHDNQVYNIVNSSTAAPCGSFADEDAKVQGIGLGGVRTRCSLTFDGGVPLSPNLDSAKGYVVNAQVYNNYIHDLTAMAGNAAVGLEVIEDTVWGNTPNAPSSQYTPGLHPDTTHNVAWNNMIWDIDTGNVTANATGILWDARGLNNATEAVPTLNQYFTQEDSIINNTVWITGHVTQTGAVVDLALNRSQNVMIFNNIFVNDDSGSSKAIYQFQVQDPKLNVNIDKNLYWFGSKTNPANQLVNLQILDPNGNFHDGRIYTTLQSWQAGSNNDEHSVYGNPQFISIQQPVDLDIQPFVSGIWSPAYQSGALLINTPVKTDIHGSVRGVGGVAYDMGADEFNGLQFSNDLSVLNITTPVSTGGTIMSANPIVVQATIRNAGNTVQLQKPVTLTVRNSGPNGSLVLSTSVIENFNINQTINVTFPGFTAQNGGTYYIQVMVPPDNNLINDTAYETTQIFVQSHPTVVSYNSSTANGVSNVDSIFHALNTLGLVYDVIDRSKVARAEDISYAPWQTVIYSTEDGSATTPNGTPYSYALSYDEIQSLKKFLNLGTPAERRGLIIAGMNLAYYHDQVTNIPAVVDTDFTRHYLYLGYVGTAPLGGQAYTGTVTGVRLETGVQEKLSNVSVADVNNHGINALSVAKTNVGLPEYAYYYNAHPNLPAGVDTAAGVTFWGQVGVTNFNAITFGYDWRHLARSGSNPNSGITDVMLNALQFMLQHEQAPVPIELLSFDAARSGSNVDLSWVTASENGIVQYNVERADAGAANWSEIPNGSLRATGGISTGANYSAVDLSLSPGTYDYRLAEIYNDGHIEYSNTQEVVIPSIYTLYQNYPNPFNSTTTIEYQMQEPGNVHLALYDVMGNSIKTLVDGQQKEGDHTVTFDAAELRTGVYYYRIDVNGYTQIRQLMLMK